MSTLRRMMVSMEIMEFADAAQWESWLASHHETADVWMKIAKKGSSHRTITIGEALDVALCYGWIDSHRKACDDDYYLQRYSPRRRHSPWSRLNTEKVAALTAAGRMREPGLAEVRKAKETGRWPVTA
jgi:uncharacterized protein YdeI (YjbR/CyaY-like superfamily)